MTTRRWLAVICLNATAQRTHQRGEDAHQGRESVNLSNRDNGVLSSAEAEGALRADVLNVERKILVLVAAYGTV